MSDNRITKVRLLNVPLENDYKNTLYFTDLQSQKDFFDSKLVRDLKFDDYSYQRKDNIISVYEHYDNLYDVNYVMYQNTAYSNKWFYAFVTKLEYVHEELTYLHIQTDVMQTWFFDYNIKQSFVEREHVDDDTVGIHTIPELLEHGEYKVNESVDEQFGDAHIVIAATYDCFKEKDAGSYINGIYHGVDYFLISDESMANASISYFLSFYAEKGKSDAITGMFMVPDDLTGYDSIEWDYMSSNASDSMHYYPYKKLSFPTGGAVDMGNKSITKPLTSIDGYTPNNKKLFTYPYQYLLLSNNNGGNAIYKYEDFSDDTFKFQTKGVITPGCSIRTIPLRYKNQEFMHEEGLNLGKYPICSYNTDVYTNWLTQNAVNIGISVASSAAQIVGGVALGFTGAGALAGAGAVTSGALGIASSLGQVYQQSLIPPQAEGNLNCGDVIYSNNKCNFTWYKMNIKKEYAQIIDKYFDMFGYKVNMIKVPNKAHRSRYWYTKTIDVNIDGGIPNDDLQQIKNCYNNGITFWRNANEIQDYSLSNLIV